MTEYAILPAPQKALLPQLCGLARAGYALYGGTAIALQLGHRESIDFDFFTAKPLAERDLVAVLPALRDATPIQREPDTWTVLLSPLDESERPVKLSFFGGLSFGRVGIPRLTRNGELLLASPLDLLGHKLKVLLQRVEAKDYRDIAALLRSGMRLEAGLGAAQALFGPSFPPAEAVRAMTYFQGGNLKTLTREDKQTLTQAAAKAGRIIPARILSNDLTVPTPEPGGPGGGSPGGGGRGGGGPGGGSPGGGTGPAQERPSAGRKTVASSRRGLRSEKGKGIGD